MVDAILGIITIETDAIEGTNTIAVCIAAVRSSEAGVLLYPNT